jgi:hypothetical protein
LTVLWQAVFGQERPSSVPGEGAGSCHHRLRIIRNCWWKSHSVANRPRKLGAPGKGLTNIHSARSPVHLYFDVAIVVPRTYPWADGRCTATQYRPSLPPYHLSLWGRKKAKSELALCPRLAGRVEGCRVARVRRVAMLAGLRSWWWCAGDHDHDRG